MMMIIDFDCKMTVSLFLFLPQTLTATFMHSAVSGMVQSEALLLIA